jgi:hypothetical protein
MHETNHGTVCVDAAADDAAVAALQRYAVTDHPFAAAACCCNTTRCYCSPLLFQFILQLQQLDLYLTLPVVLQNGLVGLLVCCCRGRSLALTKARNWCSLEVELVGLYMSAGACTTRGEDTNLQ